MDVRDLRTLVERSDPPCVTLCMHVDAVGPAVRRNRIRLSNLLDLAAAALRERGTSALEVDALLATARERVDDELFWRHRDAGLAVLIDRNGTRWIDGSQPLPLVCRVSDRFYAKPLLRLCRPRETFWLLSLSRNEVKLFSGDVTGLHAVDHPALPKSLEDALGSELVAEPLQSHSGSAASVRGTIFHGQGWGDDDRNEELVRFLYAVDRGLHEAIGEDDAPLIIASLGRNAAAFRALSRHPRIVKATIEGNPSLIPEDRLHAKAWSIARPVLERTEHEDRQRFERLYTTELAGSDPAEILRASEQGRVESLFAAVDAERWGRISGDTRDVELHDEPLDDDDDLIDEIVVRCLMTGARIYAEDQTDVPGPGSLAAVYRY